VINDLVLTGTIQGNLVALNRTTGKIVWTHDVGYPISGWPSVAGGLLVVPTGMVAGSGHLVAFRLPTP
jgi:outer membrane protein assembly factor BamB